MINHADFPVTLPARQNRQTTEPCAKSQALPRSSPALITEGTQHREENV